VSPSQEDGDPKMITSYSYSFVPNMYVTQFFKSLMVGRKLGEGRRHKSYERASQRLLMERTSWSVTTIGLQISSTFSWLSRYFTMVRANSKAVPGPRLVMSLP